MSGFKTATPLLNETPQNTIYSTEKPYLLPKNVLEAPEEAWDYLKRYDKCLTRAEFTRLLHDFFDPCGQLANYMTITDTEARFFVNKQKLDPPCHILQFAQKQDPRPSFSRSYRKPEEFRALSKTKPLEGLRVAIDPADIGGTWGPIEERSVLYRNYGRLQEGDLNLINAKLIRDKLVELGAEVCLSHEKPEPVMTGEPKDLMEIAKAMLNRDPNCIPVAYKQKSRHLTPPKRLQVACEILFTKTFETRARVQKIHETFQPDITIVLQYNATQGSGRGRLAKLNRNVIFIPGAYMPREIDDPRQRFQLVYKLLDQTLSIEAEVAHNISQSFQAITGFPPVKYGNSKSTRQILPEDPYIVARNISVSREHVGPVVVVEPYFMNEANTLKRLLALDYEGSRIVAGKPQISIFREYSEAVIQGILLAYAPEAAKLPRTCPEMAQEPEKKKK